MRRSPLPASNSANLTDELPELSTSTKPPGLPAVAWSKPAAVVVVLGMLLGAGGDLCAALVMVSIGVIWLSFRPPVPGYEFRVQKVRSKARSLLLQPSKRLPAACARSSCFSPSRGLPRGRSTLVTGGTGSGKTLLGLHFLVAGAREHGEPGVLVTFEESAEKVSANVA